jgi:vacuolar-type H+-ATPase subunit E/Vma4
MKNLKKILLSLVIASAMGAVSTIAVAESDPGRITYAPAEAIDMVAGKVKLAIDAIASGSDGETVSKLIKDALDASKEINANDKVDMARSRANNKLKAAKAKAKENALQEAEQELRNAYKGFQDLKGML